MTFAGQPPDPDPAPLTNPQQQALGAPLTLFIFVAVMLRPRDLVYDSYLNESRTGETGLSDEKDHDGMGPA